MTKLRIAHVLSSFRVGGQERVALDLARSHHAEGHAVFAYSIDPLPEGPLGAHFRAAGVAARTVARGPRIDPTLVVRLATALARDRVDLVHTHNPLAMTYGAPAGKLVRAAMVHTKHGENVERSRRVLLRRAIAKLTDAFVAVSGITADAARATRDVHEAKLRVIPNAIDTSRFVVAPGSRSSIRRELGVPEEAWVVGSIGRLVPGKNQVALIRALAAVLGDRWRLVIVGDGPELPALRRAAAEAGVASWVHLTGAREDVPRVLTSFDTFALPSASEGLPLVVLEAMATGLPVVASNVGGLPEVVAEGVTGHLVPAGDPAHLHERLVAMASDPARTRAMGAAARDVIRERYSLERMSGAYMSLYRQLTRT